MVAASDLVVALIHRPQDRLVGFARVLTDQVFIGVVLDVVVAPEARGNRLGARLTDAIVTHPALAGLRAWSWGFTDRVGRSRLMRGTGNARSTTP